MTSPSSPHGPPSVGKGICPEDFNKYQRYTTTYIAATNWTIDYISLFHHLPITELPDDPLKGVKRSQVKLSVPIAILQIKYKDAYKIVHVRGYGIDDEASLGCFSNSASVVMYVGKIVVLKIPPQGKIQITGCRTESQVYKAVHAIWEGISSAAKEHPEILSLPAGELPKVIYHGVMNNISMNIGFNINKRKTHEYLYNHTEFHIIPNDKKYAGIAAKLVEDRMKDVPLVKHRLINGKWYESTASWNDYLAVLTAKDRQKEGKCERYQTFLIFHSGKVIQTGPRYCLMKDMFSYFVNLMNRNRNLLEDLTVEVAKKPRSRPSTTTVNTC